MWGPSALGSHIKGVLLLVEKVYTVDDVYLSCENSEVLILKFKMWGRENEQKNNHEVKH